MDLLLSPPLPRSLRVYCQQQGGLVVGTVFHDADRNGVYDPDQGETPFRPRRAGDRLTVALVDCDPPADDDGGGDGENSFTCDLEPTPLYRDSRRFEVDAVDGTFSFDCFDCYGRYKLQMAYDTYASDYFDDDAAFDDDAPVLSVSHDDDWATSSARHGGTREGSGSPTLRPDPAAAGATLRNNFFENGETACFDMYGDLDTLRPYAQVIDWGLYYASDDVGAVDARDATAVDDAPTPAAPAARRPVSELRDRETERGRRTRPARTTATARREPTTTTTTRGGRRPPF